MSEYKFRFIKSSWGIAIDITGTHITLKNTPNSKYRKISSKIWLDLQSQNINLNERKWIYKGLELVADNIISKINISDYVLITISKTDFNICDYQPDGLYCAVVCWASEEFDFLCPKINIEFDKKQNQYLIDLPSNNINE